jgi:hypothetical protein
MRQTSTEKSAPADSMGLKNHQFGDPGLQSQDFPHL